MRLKQKLSSVLLAATLLAPFLPGQALAATGAIYITPASSSLQAGGSETLSLRINPGTTVDGVQATVSYNSGALQLNGVDTSGSPFTVTLQKSAGGGVITLALGNLSGGVSSDSLIATMSFTALSGSGSTSLVVSNANATSGGSYTNPAASGATISLSSPAGSGGGGGGGSGGGTVSSGAGSTSTKTRTGVNSPTASNSSSTAAQASPQSSSAPATQPSATVQLKAKVVKTGLDSATVSVSGNQVLDVFAMYGTSAGQLTSKSLDFISKSGKLDLASLTPGTDYYYQVVGVDGSGQQTKLAVEHFVTQGYKVSVTVLGQGNKPLANTQVTLHSRAQTVKTDTQGVATFTGVAPGLHHLEYKADGRSYSLPVYVENQKSPDQSAAVVLPVQAAGGEMNGIVAGLIVVCALVVFLAAVEVFRHEQVVRHKAFKLAIVGRSFLF